jgi:preprotein translocase subunit SecG
MISFITILILLACVVLGFFVLIQNPKGGGLTGAFGSISSQVMGVKQSTDVMEKGTWTAMGVVCALCIVSVMFFEKPKTDNSSKQGTRSSAPAAKGAAPAGKAKK